MPEHSILKSILDNKKLGAYLSKREVDDSYWPMFCPYKFSLTLEYSTLIGAYGAKVAAAVIAHNASSPKGTRKVISELKGSLPKIAIKREMTELDLHQFIALSQMSKLELKPMLDLVYNDVNFAFDSVNARQEWLTLRMLSHGEITLDSTTNPHGLVTESVIDFQVPSANKIGAAVDWSAAANTTTPITDFITAKDLMIVIGMPCRYVAMSPTSFTHLRKSNESSDFVFGRAAPSITKWPTQKELNAELKLNALPEIIIVQTSIDLSGTDYASNCVNPWYEGVVTFMPDLPIGNMVYTTSAEEYIKPKQVIQAVKDNILISKWSEMDPVNEFTKGEISAFPSWHRAHECILMYSLDTTWTI